MWARVPSLMNASRSRFVLFVVSRAGVSVRLRDETETECPYVQF